MVQQAVEYNIILTEFSKARRREFKLVKAGYRQVRRATELSLSAKVHYEKDILLILMVCWFQAGLSELSGQGDWAVCPMGKDKIKN